MLLNLWEKRFLFLRQEEENFIVIQRMGHYNEIMRRTLFLILLPLLLSAKEFKIALIDMDRILKEYKDLQDAKLELQRYIAEWERTRDSLKLVIDSLENLLETEKPMLSDEAKLRREEEIEELKREFNDFWMSIWGEEGQLKVKTREIIEPLTKKVNETVRKIAQDFDYDLVLDISSHVVLFAKSEDDITQMVLDELNKEYVATRQPEPTLEPFVAVFPLKELDDPSKQRDLGRKLQNYITRGIDASPQFKTISPGQILSEMEREGIVQIEFLTEAVCQRIARALGAEFYVYGTVKKSGDEVEFEISLIKIDGNVKVAEGSERSPDQDVELQVKATDLAKRLVASYKPGG
jgi:outer membrane protein